ncbi:DUF2069 domain-containing protein [Phytopseudomonas dryadis]|uniref:DUF2069 domain-containing protein n=1 Tax=Phytopseudomonas dryadis TaxID=2487520 RepID=A0A4Q9QY04_9GAMM|nr:MULTISPECIES: DUF2069 domain-containing protein [Pseudomonas]TBU90000.1 DUF2069 domain-containing protein [Pseudomonas dryadis]TBV02636.1 DUF2069 domain-containing protein [Pseudomonas dryadis]TBV15488.1 DUF2069 domain-containing protein [Pseudomonas sp. FRB 230]
MARTLKPLPSIEWLQPRLRLSRYLSLASFLALAALLLIWNLGYAAVPGSLLWAVLAFQLLPLLLLAPGMIAGHPRAHAWACFVVNLYFIQGVLAAFDPSKALFGWLEILLSMGLFISALLYTRWCAQYQYIDRLSDNTEG